MSANVPHQDLWDKPGAFTLLILGPARVTQIVQDSLDPARVEILPRFAMRDGLIRPCGTSTCRDENHRRRTPGLAAAVNGNTAISSTDYSLFAEDRRRHDHSARRRLPKRLRFSLNGFMGETQRAGDLVAGLFRWRRYQDRVQKEQ